MINTSFFRLPDSFYIIPVKSSLITRFCYLSQVTYFHDKDAIVAKIENIIFIFYFNIKFPIFIVILYQSGPNPGNIYLFKLSRNTRKRCEISTKLAIKAPERRHWSRSGVIIVGFEHTSHHYWLIQVIKLLGIQEIQCFIQYSWKSEGGWLKPSTHIVITIGWSIVQ